MFVINVFISAIKRGVEFLSNQPFDKNHVNFLRNMSWSALTTFVCSGTTFATGIIVARLLGPDNFGKIAILLSIAQVIQLVLLLGTDSSSIHAVIESKTWREKAQNISAPIHFLAGVSLIGLVAALLFLFLPSKLLVFDRPFIISCYGLALVLSFKLLLDGLIRSLGYFKQQFTGRLAEAFFVPAIFLLLYLSGFKNYNSYIIGLIFGAAVCVSFYTYHLYPYFTNFDKQKLLAQISHGKLFLQGSISAAAYAFIERITIAKFMSLSDLGLFTVYLNSSANASNQLALILINVFFPTAIMSKDKKVFIAAIEKFVAFSFIPLFILFLVLVYFVIYLLGSAYSISWAYKLAFVFLAIFQLISTVYSYLIAALSKKYLNQKNLLMTTLSLTNLIAFAILIYFSLFTIKFVVLVCLCNVMLSIVFQKLLINKIKLRL